LPLNLEVARLDLMANGTGVQSEKNWQRIGVLAFAVAAFLLVSMGGAIAAAPVTVPLMYVVSRHHPTSAFRIAAAVLGGFTVAEAAWALTYLLTTEANPWIWAVPLASGATAAVGLAGGVRLGRGPNIVKNSVGAGRRSS